MIDKKTHRQQKVAWLGVKQASELLGVDRATVTRWAKSGVLEVEGRVGEGRTSVLVFDRKNVEKLAARRKAEAAA